MFQPSITGHGVFTPEQTISNDELVASFNAYAAKWNAAHADEIARGELDAKTESSAGFILSTSGIESRHVLDKEGVLDPGHTFPDFP